MAELAEAADDIQAKVLQTTLAGISSSRSGGSAPPNECCVICLDVISEPSAALPCGHNNFDFVCLLSWLQESVKCPLCKSNVYKVRYKDATASESTYRVPNAIKTRSGDAEPAREQPADEFLWRRRRRSLDSIGGAHRLLSRPAEAIDRRRHVYRHQLYSLHVGSNRISQYGTSPTPKDFATTPHLVSRARLWIRRELQVFTFLVEPSETSDSGNVRGAETRSRRRDNAEFLLEYIIAIIKTVDLQGSAGQAEDMLSDFLGRDNARLFLHELRNWLRSPCQSLVVWDRETQYPDEHHERRVFDDSENDHVPQMPNDLDRPWVWQDSRGGDHWRASRPHHASRSGPKRRNQEASDNGSERPRTRIRGE